MERLWRRILEPGEKWSGYIGRGKFVRFKALEDNANVSMLLYNSFDKSERFTAPDSLKIHHTIYFEQGAILLSESGRVMASIVQDSTGWIDAISGFTTRKGTNEKYGEHPYQKYHNDMYRCGEENFAVELTRNGLSMRDMVPCLNLFSKVGIKEDGSVTYDDSVGKEGDTITFRTEMDVLLVLSNTPNAYDPSTVYAPPRVEIEVYDAPAVSLTDPCVNTPENYRAFQNTWEYYTLMGR